MVSVELRYVWMGLSLVHLSVEVNGERISSVVLDGLE